MTGFKSEVESGARSGFSGIAKIAGVAFGAAEAFRFGKEIVGHAADVQKQVQAIGNEFGKSGDQIIKFGENAATGLGISEHLAVRTGARFGILFKNLGIGHEQAAAMTVGFEKLAGSLSAIRNVDPALVLQNLPLAVAGNLRSLKQLGIATDQTQLKIAAFKLGLTQNVKEGLTPTTRAIAIYAIATAHLPEFLRQAASHSQDLANKQRRLRAEWDNAKDSLGRGLLPAMAAITGYLAANLPHALATVHRGFTTLQNDLRAVTGPVGGLKNVVIGLTAAFVISKITAYGKALVTNLVAKGRAAAAAKAGAAIEVTAEGQVTAATVELTGAVRALATAFEMAAATGVTSMKVLQGATSTTAGSMLALRGTAAAVGPTVAVGAAEAIPAVGGMTAAFIGLRVAIMGLLSATVIGAVFVALGFAAMYVITHWDKVKGWFISFAHFLPVLFKSIWHELEGEFQVFIYFNLKGFGLIASAAAKAFGWIPGIGPKIKAASATFNDWIDGFKNRGLAEISAAGEAMAQGFVDAFKGSIEKTLNNYNPVKPKKTLSALAKAGFTTDLLTGNTIKNDGTIKKVKDASQKVMDELRALHGHYEDLLKVNDAGVTKIRNQLKELNITLVDALKQQALDINQAVGDAKSNLLSVAQSLSDAVGAILDKPLQNAQDKISRAANLQSLADLRRSVLLPGGRTLSADPQKGLAQLEALAHQTGNVNKAAIESFITQYKTALLTVRQDQVNVVKDHVKQNLADLANDLNTGKISVATFNKRVLATLKGAGAGYKRAGALLGSSFATGFNEQLHGLLGQAAAIAAGPQRAAVTGQAVNIVKPLEVLTKSQKDIAKINREIAAKQTGLQTRIAKNADKQTALLKKINDVQLGKVPGVPSKATHPGNQSKTSKALSGPGGTR